MDERSTRASTRAQFVETTATLLEAQGYHATGLNQILAESGAPRGSLYYHFPGGKEQLAAEAVERAAALVTGRVERELAAHDDPAEAVCLFVRTIAQYVEASGFRGGGPLTIVALETAASGDRLNLVCRAAYRRIEGAFAARLSAGGFAPDRAARLATVITAAIEGGTMLSRTAHSGDPLRLVAETLGDLLRVTPRA